MSDTKPYKMLQVITVRRRAFWEDRMLLSGKVCVPPNPYNMLACWMVWEMKLQETISWLTETYFRHSLFPKSLLYFLRITSSLIVRLLLSFFSLHFLSLFCFLSFSILSGLCNFNIISQRSVQKPQVAKWLQLFCFNLEASLVSLITSAIFDKRCNLSYWVGEV